MPRPPRLYAALLLLALAAGTATAADGVRVLVDVSGSMREHDPEQLRAPALELAVDLLPEGTEAGVWHFAGDPEAMVEPAPVDDRWREGARGAVQGVNSGGQHTDLTGAIDAATADWAEDGDGGRSLILLTDGVIDVGDGSNDDSRRRLTEEILPRLQAAGVRLYPVALSTDEGMDEGLLLQLATATGGEVIVAPDGERLERRMVGLLDRLAAGDALPLQGNRFQVDQSVRELTLVAFREPGAEVTLQPPAGAAFGADSAPAGVRWRRERGHDIVTITQPANGEWTLQAPVDPDNRVSVVTDLRLRAEPLPARLLPGEPATLTAWLADGERRIDETRFLELVRLEAVGPGASAPVPIEADAEGRFHLPAARLLSDDGPQEIRLQADGGTFQREWRQRVRVEAEPLQLSAEAAEPGALRVRATLASDWLAADSLRLAASYAAPGLRGERLEANGDGRRGWTLETRGLAPGTPVLVSTRLSGLTRSGRPVSTLLLPRVMTVQAPAASADPAATAAGDAAAAAAATAAAADGDAGDDAEPAATAQADADSGINWWLVTAVLILANLFVVLAGLLTWLVLKRRAAPAEDTPAAADEDGPATDTEMEAGQNAEADAQAEEETAAQQATGG